MVKRPSALVLAGALLLPALSVLFPVLSSAAAPQGLERSRGKLTVKANLNTEVMYVLLNLTGTSKDLTNRKYMPVYDDVLAFFGKYKDHPAVKELEDKGPLNWYPSGFSYGAFAKYPLFFADLPGGEKIAPYDPEFLDRLIIPGIERGDRLKKAAYLDAYWEKVRDFYKASSFSVYWEKEKARYEGFVADLFGSLPEADIITLHEAYHNNSSFARFCIIASAMTLPSGGNYGVMITGEKGDTTVYNVMSASRDKWGEEAGFKSKENIEDLNLHEFGHSFCNPVAARYYPGSVKYDFLLDGLKGKIDDAYLNWQAMMNELLVRSVHGRHLLKLKGEAAAAEYLKEQRERDGFIFVGDYYRLLGEFEESREKYQTMGDFYPVLVESLAGWGVYEVEEPLKLGLTWFRETPEGAFMIKPASAGAGYAAGIRAGDTVAAVNGERISDADAFGKVRRDFEAMPVGGVSRFSMIRKDGSKAEVEVKRISGKLKRVVRLGSEFKNVKKKAARSLGLWWGGFSAAGMTVTFLDEKKTAYLEGLRVGDIVKAVDAVPMTREEAYRKVDADWEKMSAGGALVFTVSRNGAEQDIRVENKYWDEVTETVKS